MRHLRTGLVFICLMGMEVCWLYALLKAANRAVDNSLQVSGLLSLLVFSWALAAVLRRIRLPRALPGLISWLVWLPAILLMIKFQLYPQAAWTDPVWLTALPLALTRLLYQLQAPLLIALAGGLLWWLGRRLAYLTPDFRAALIELQLGLVVLALTFFIAYQFNLDQSASTVLALVFFFLALTGVAAAHAREDGWLFSAGKGHWMGLTLGCVLGVLLLGLLAGLIFTPDLIQVLVKTVKWIWHIIEIILRFIAGLIPFGDHGPMDTEPVPDMPAVEEDTGNLFSLSDRARSILRFGWTLMILALVLAFIWKAASELYQWLRRRGVSSGTETENLKGAFREDLIRFLKNLFGWLYRLISGRRKRRETDETPRSVLITRRTYARFLKWAASRGYPREPSWTPQEYCLALSRQIPAGREALEVITGEYLKVRYGAAVPAEEDLERLTASWQSLKHQGLKHQGLKPQGPPPEKRRQDQIEDEQNGKDESTGR